MHTAEETYQGKINVTRATIVSDNTVYAQLAADLGWSKLDATAHAMGIDSPLDGNPAEVIGGLRIGVTPLEMADAYATLANGGCHVPARRSSAASSSATAASGTSAIHPHDRLPLRRGV